MTDEQKKILKQLQGSCTDEKLYKKVRITTELYLYVGEDESEIREKFAEMAWENNRKATEPDTRLEIIEWNAGLLRKEWKYEN